MNFESIKKKCQFCNFNTILLYKSNETISCPLCIGESTFVNNFIASNTSLLIDKLKYHYCCDCNILFRYNENNIHHALDNYGKFYYADMISKYRIDGSKEIEQMPKFQSIEKCFCLINDNLIKFEWVNFMKNDECCVCAEDTVTFTECGHPLCKRCRDYIDKDECPICRKKQQCKNYYRPFIPVQNSVDNKTDRPNQSN